MEPADRGPPIPQSPAEPPAAPPPDPNSKTQKCVLPVGNKTLPNPDLIPQNIQFLFQQLMRNYNQGQFGQNRPISPGNSANSTWIRFKVPKRPEKKKKVSPMIDDIDEDSDSETTIRIPQNKAFLRFRLPEIYDNRPVTPQNRIIQPKRVLTPDWESAQAHSIHSLEVIQHEEEEEEPTDNPFHSNWQTFDMVERHRRIELFESRIIWGSDLYQHPAQAVTPAYYGIPYAMSEEEYKKANRYETETITAVVPKFWIPRVWDRPECALDEKQTEELEKAISDSMTPKLPRSSSTSPHPRKLPKRSQSQLLQPARRGRPRRVQPEIEILSLPLGVYWTDDEEGDTDWEEGL